MGNIKNTQNFDAYPNGIIYSNGKILTSISGAITPNSFGYPVVNQLIVFNQNLDTLQTMTLAAGTGTNSNYYLQYNLQNNCSSQSYSYKPGYLASIFYKKSNSILPDTTGHKAYASKNYQNAIYDLRQLKDSSYVGLYGLKTQVVPWPAKFGLWWLDKNLDTLRNVYYDFNLWQTGGCLLRNLYELPKKDLLLGGYTDSLDKADGLVMKVDSLGSIKYAKSIGTDSFDVLNFIKVKKSYYLYGNTDKFKTQANDYYNRLLLIKIDSIGNVVFAKSIYNNEGNLSFTYKAINFNDDLLWYGSQNNNNLKSQRGCLALLMDTNGVVKKYHKAIYNPITNYNTQNPREEFTSAVLDSLKNVYLQYYYYNNAFTNNDGFQTGLVKLDSNLVGCIPSVVQSFTTTDVTSLVHSVPINYTVKRDSLIRVTGTINQSYGISGITEDCAAYVGLQEYNIQNQFIKLYPNPSVGLFNYELLDANSMTGDYTMEIYNSVGAIIKRYVINKNDIQGSIDLTEFSNGIYFINIINSNKIILNTKLCVIK